MKRRWNVNKFGAEYLTVIGPEGTPGSPGPRGPAGKDGTDGKDGVKGHDAMNICRWFPTQTIKWFRENEACCYYFEKDGEKDCFIKKEEKVIGFKSHTTEPRIAACLKEFEGTQKLPGDLGLGVNFKNSLYKVQDIDLATYYPSYAMLLMTFKFDNKTLSTEEYLINCDNRAVSAYKNNIRIWGTASDPLEIPCKFDKWITLLVQWTWKEDDKTGFVYLEDHHDDNRGGQKRSFTTALGGENKDLFIGAKQDGTLSFSGCLAALEVYTAELQIENTIPDGIRTLLFMNQSDMVEDPDPVPNLIKDERYTIKP